MVPHAAQDLVQAHLLLEERASLLRGPCVQQVGSQSLLYVQQRELAVTSPKDSSFSILGSDDATTVALWCGGTEVLGSPA